jgi:acid phosphatase type 7
MSQHHHQAASGPPRGHFERAVLRDVRRLAICGQARAALVCSLFGLLASCAHGGEPRAAAQAKGPVPALFTVPDAQLRNPLSFIVYGDMRFTNPAETGAAAPGPRLALVTRIASLPVDAVFLTGDIPWRGGELLDYGEYEKETAPWRERHLRIYPVLGNHEFAQCAEAVCLENWWQTFPELRGHRWYAVALGSRVRVIALDSDTSLLPGSEQREWLEQEIESLSPQVRFVILALHHPPVADEGFVIVRPNERSLRAYLSSIAPRSAARFIVCSAHVHNYERFETDGVVYLVSGGGGAKPLAVGREAADKYQEKGFPNFHYIHFTLQGERLSAEMTRLEDYEAPVPQTWAIRDRFEVLGKAP